MGCEAKEIERFLEVGAIMVFHTEPNRRDGPRHKTILRGWRKPSHMLFDRPKTESGLFAALQEGQPCVVRYLHEGLACAFDTIVIDWDNRRSNPYLRVTWPHEIQYVQFRKFERLRISFPCIVHLENGDPFEGEMQDLSGGGCGLLCTTFLKEPVRQVSLSFTLPDGTPVEKLKTEVRNQRPSGGGTFLGVEFLARQERAQNDIMFFVTSRLDRSKGSDQPAPKVLLIDEDVEFASRLRRCFERRNTDVICATTTLDGLVQLRMSPPRALLVSAAMNDLPAVDLCRLIRKTKGVEDLHVFVYGGEAQQLESILLQSGANGYFPPKSSLAPDMAFEVGQMLEKASHQPS